MRNDCLHAQVHFLTDRALERAPEDERVGVLVIILTQLDDHLKATAAIASERYVTRDMIAELLREIARDQEESTDGD